MLPCDGLWSVSYWLGVIFCFVGAFLTFVALTHAIVQIRRRNRSKALQGDRAKVAEARITSLECVDIESGTHQCSYEFEVSMPDGGVRHIVVQKRRLPRRVAEEVLPGGAKVTETSKAQVRYLPEDPSYCMLACNVNTQSSQTVRALGLAMVGIVLGLLLVVSALDCHAASGIIASVPGALLGLLYVRFVMRTMGDPLREGVIKSVDPREPVQPSSYGQKIPDESESPVDNIAA